MPIIQSAKAARVNSNYITFSSTWVGDIIYNHSDVPLNVLYQFFASQKATLSFYVGIATVNPTDQVTLTIDLFLQSESVDDINAGELVYTKSVNNTDGIVSILNDAVSLDFAGRYRIRLTVGTIGGAQLKIYSTAWIQLTLNT